MWQPLEDVGHLSPDHIIQNSILCCPNSTWYISGQCSMKWFLGFWPMGNRCFARLEYVIEMAGKEGGIWSRLPNILMCLRERSLRTYKYPPEIRFSFVIEWLSESRYACNSSRLINLVTMLGLSGRNSMTAARPCWHSDRLRGGFYKIGNGLDYEPSCHDQYARRALSPIPWFRFRSCLT